jgi:predicted site-specific integrase-resolvase
MKRNEVYKTPKEIHEEFGISPANLKKYRLAGHLKKIKWSIGRGKPYYNLEEIKKIFYK